jgi:polyhydroxybutyrate depolymerase
LLGPVLAAQAAESDRQTLDVGGVSRSYVLRLPDGLTKNARAVPLVFVLHGGGGNAANAENMTGFTAKGNREGFIVVYPEGTGPIAGALLTWNARHCCAYAMKNDVDDVGFIRALLADLSARYPVDARRVYATGMSNGAMMTHRLGIELSDRLAAIATVVGTIFGDERKPAHAVPALMINGLLDQNVPHDGGAPGGRGAHSWDGTPTLPATQQLAFWDEANDCTDTPHTQDDADWLVWRGECRAGHDVVLYLIKDNGHAWPGGQPGSRRGDAPSTAMNATDVIWEFFKSHPR